MDFTYEHRYGWPMRTVVGVDEAGRGPWAGPVVAAAVILPHDFDITGLRDSKKLSGAKREKFATYIRAHAISGVGAASVTEIDRFNILQASLRAMRRAIFALAHPPVHALIDGTHTPSGLPMPSSAIIGGDGFIPSIAAAAILAKTTRDSIMRRLDTRYPAYNWRQNKGYGTQAHRIGIGIRGVSAHHRVSFRPIRDFMTAVSSPP